MGIAFYDLIDLGKVVNAVKAILGNKLKGLGECLCYIMLHTSGAANATVVPVMLLLLYKY